MPRLGRSPGEGNGNPLQYACLENSMDGGAWWATVHAVAKIRMQLSDFTLLERAEKTQSKRQRNKSKNYGSLAQNNFKYFVF